MASSRLGIERIEEEHSDYDSNEENEEHKILIVENAPKKDEINAAKSRNASDLSVTGLQKPTMVSQRGMSQAADAGKVASNRVRLLSVLEDNNKLILKAKRIAPKVYRNKRSKSSEALPIEPLLTESSESEEKQSN